MKISTAAFALLLMTSTVLAGEDTPKKLVADYIKAVKAEQLITAEIEASIQQFSANATPEQKTLIERYFNATMGWEAIKDQYAALIERVYTPDELRTILAFLKTPAGSSIGAKNVQFARDWATTLSKNAQKFNQAMIDGQETSGTTASPPSDGDLVALHVEEHTFDGKTYFTGVIENRGKKARRGVQVEVNLFQGDKFVDQYSTYVSGIVAPGGQRYFKIACGCEDSPPAAHDSYKVLVIEGY